jgi:hypothetical protein
MALDVGNVSLCAAVITWDAFGSSNTFRCGGLWHRLTLFGFGANIEKWVWFLLERPFVDMV